MQEFDNPHTLSLHDEIIHDARDPEKSPHIEKRATLIGMTKSEYASFISRYPYLSAREKKIFLDLIIVGYSIAAEVEKIYTKK
jgi:hypothetical protein